MSLKINVHIICFRPARALHLLQAPVFAFAGNRKRHLAFALARFAAVDVADLRDDRAGEGEGFGFDGGDRAVHFDEVGILPAFLLAFYKQHAVLFGDGRCTEVIPTDPLQRELVLAEQFGFGRGVGGFGLRLQREREGDDEQY